MCAARSQEPHTALCNRGYLSVAGGCSTLPFPRQLYHSRTTCSCLLLQQRPPCCSHSPLLAMATTALAVVGVAQLVPVGGGGVTGGGDGTPPGGGLGLGLGLGWGLGVDGGPPGNTEWIKAHMVAGMGELVGRAVARTAMEQLWVWVCQGMQLLWVLLCGTHTLGPVGSCCSG
jgi:hypothetical protein